MQAVARSSRSLAARSRLVRQPSSEPLIRIAVATALMPYELYAPQPHASRPHSWQRARLTVVSDRLAASASPMSCAPVLPRLFCLTMRLLSEVLARTAAASATTPSALRTPWPRKHMRRARSIHVHVHAVCGVHAVYMCTCMLCA